MFWGIKTFQMKTRILYGHHASEIIGQEIDPLSQTKNVFIVTDKGVRKSGILNVIETELGKKNLRYLIYDEIPEDPTIETVEAVLQELIAYKADVVIGFGGGSPMCAAKAAAMLVTNGGQLLEYEGVHKTRVESIPVIAIPTTAGSGTEVSPVFIIKNRSDGRKMIFLSQYHYPRVALLDPMFLDTIPPKQAVYASADALSHAVEAYLSTDATPLTDTIALKALSMIYENIGPTAFSRSRERQLNILLASTMANIACGNARLGLIHVMADDLRLPHGLACGILLPHVLEYNLPACEHRMADIATAWGLERSAEKTIEAVRRLWSKVGIPYQLDGKPHKAVEEVVKRVMNDPLLKYNARIPEPADVGRIWTKLFLEN